MRPTSVAVVRRTLAGAPLFACGMAYWACALVGVVLLRTASLEAVGIVAGVAVAGALALGAAGACSCSFRKPCAIAVCALLALGSAAYQVQELRSSPVLEGAHEAELRLSGDALPAGSGAYAYATAVFPEGFERQVRVRLPAVSELRAGAALRVQARFERVDFAGDDFLWFKGVAYTCTVSDYDLLPDTGPGRYVRALRGKVVEELVRQGDGNGIVAAVVCGWRAQLYASDAYGAFRKGGTAHLVAVSGAHLAIVAAAVMAFARALELPRAAATVTLAALLGGYFALAGAPVSCLRALVMAIVSSLSYLGVRRPHALNALGASMLGILACDPWSCTSVSFALSCLATAGILVLAQPVDTIIGRSIPVLPPAVRGPLAVTTAASIAVQPLSCALFGVLPLVAPVANLCAAVLFQPLCLAGFAGGLLAAAAPPLAAPFLALARLAADALRAAVSALVALPQSWLPVELSYGGAAIASVLLVGATLAVLAYEHPARILVPCALAATVVFGGRIAYLQGQDAIIMFDVGQGDSFLVRSGGVTLVIDTGNDAEKLERALQRFAVTRCAFALITHKDADHSACLGALDARAPVDVLLLADGLQRSDDAGCRKLVREGESVAGAVAYLKPGDRIAFGHARMTVLWPDAIVDAGGNADSLSVLIEFDVDDDGEVDASALFVGDCEHEQTARMAEAFGVDGVDILKVGHHGSAESLDEALVQALHPRVALIGVGANNGYGHPTPRTLGLLDSAGTRVYRSDLDGDVSCKLGAGRIEVHRSG